MISSVTVENFGPYSTETAIELGPFTVVTSDRSDRGKSWAVMRSLDWCLFNAGLAFNSDDAKDEIRHTYYDGSKAPFARVRVTMDTGVWVERYRSATKNQYTIFDGAKEETYSSFGQGFFDKVGEATGIKPVCLDGKTTENVNLHGFYDPPMLLTRSPAQIDTILSRLMGSDVWEDAAALIAADLRKAQAAAKSAQEQLTNYEDQLCGYAGIENGFALLEQAEKLEAAAKSLAEQREQIARLIEQKQGLLSRVRPLEKVVDKLTRLVQDAAVVVEEDEQCRRALSDAERVVALARQAETLRVKIADEEAQCGELGRRVSGAGRFTDLVLEKRDLCEWTAALEAKKRAAEKLLMEISNVNAQIETLSSRVDEARSEFEQALEAAGVCPLCGSVIEHDGECAA